MNNKNNNSSRIVWLAGAGLFLATLDTGIINVALPAIQIAWHARASTVAWAVVAYTIPLIGSILFWGRLADRVNPHRIFWWGLVGFGAASGLCGGAMSLRWLIGARALQGFASAMLQGTAIALAMDRLPLSQKGLAAGTLALFQGLGPVIGPTVGGVLLTWTSWRELFFINLPVVVLLLIGLGRPKGKMAGNNGSRQATLAVGGAWNVPGNLLLMGSVVLGLMALTVHSHRLEWAILTVLAVTGLIGWERRALFPLVPRTFWSSRAFWSAVGAMVVVGGATSIAFMVVPYSLQRHTPWQIGLINMSAPAMLVLCSRPLSRYIKTIGSWPLMGTGLALMGGAFALLAATSWNHDLIIMVVELAIYGVGAAAFFPANLAGLLTESEDGSHGVVGAIQRMAINIGTAVDATVVGDLLTRSHGSLSKVAVSSIRAAWLYGVTTLFVAGIGMVWAYYHQTKRLSKY